MTKLPTVEEAFVVHQVSNAFDTAGGIAMNLNGVIERLDPSIEDKVHGNLAEFLQKMVDRTLEGRDRIRDQTVEYVGGEKRYQELNMSNFDGISLMRTWMNKTPSDLDGNPVEVQDETL